MLHKIRSYAGPCTTIIYCAKCKDWGLHSLCTVCLVFQRKRYYFVLCFSGIEDKSLVLSMDQMEWIFKPQNMLATSELFCHGSETSNMLYHTKLKREPEEIPQLVPTPGEAIIALDFGQNSTHRYLYPHNNFCLYSTLSFDSMPTPLLHAWTHLINLNIHHFLPQNHSMHMQCP